jgi:nucleoside-diphosphate-sugar epimerase
VFDREALIQAVRDFKPDVVLNELTDLPDDAAQISELAGLNARIPIEGTQNLIEAARRNGSPKFWLKASPGNYLMGLMPRLSQNWSVPSAS